jgi:hypothetical protein
MMKWKRTADRDTERAKPGRPGGAKLPVLVRIEGLSKWLTQQPTLSGWVHY